MSATTGPRRRVLLSVTYYRPYTSGLTIYVERLARGLAERGHQVTVLTSQYERDLPEHEVDDAGVAIVRVPVWRRVNKGVVMPRLGRTAERLIREHDVVNAHLPQFDSPGLALRSRRHRTPVVLTYHCDVKLAPSPFNAVANAAVNAANHLGARWCDAIVTYTQDYADHSPYLRRFADKVRIITPPVDFAEPDPAAVARFAEQWRLDGPVIGMAARLAAEKGVEVLLRALPAVLERHPDARVLFAGPHEHVLGEEAYATALAPLLERHRDRWSFVGTLGGAELAAFYANCSTIVVPSLNSTEAFGLVQVEAMLCGTPSIASDLPGVRQPVRQTGMGQVVPIGDSAALAAAINDVIDHRDAYVRPRHEIADRYNDDATVSGYEQLFGELIDGRVGARIEGRVDR